MQVLPDELVMFLLPLYCVITVLLLPLLSRSVVSNPVRPQRPQPIRLPGPWDFPGKNTGVGCHFLPQITVLI